MHFSFSLRSRSERTPSRFPNRAPMETAAHLQGFFLSLHITQIPHKNFPKQRNFSLLSKTLGKERPSMFPKSGAPMETDAHFQSLT